MHHWGSAFQQSLPHANAERDGKDAVFSPAVLGYGAGLAGMAYAVYKIQLDGYDQEATLRFAWQGAGGYNDAWVGLSNFQRDRWDWRPLPFDGNQPFDPALCISSTGEMYVVVMCGGTLPWRLMWLRVGPEFVPPDAALEATPQAGNAPLTVSFDASASFDPDGGNIAQYEWDWEADGIYDNNSGSSAFAGHEYLDPGDYTATVQVTDDEAQKSTVSLLINVTDLVLNADTLYAIPLATQAAVGEHVRILVATGQTAHPLAFLSDVSFTVEDEATYVGDSYNYGLPGGSRLSTDGYWALMGPPPPGAGDYIDLGDGMVPGDGTLISGGLRRLSFMIVTMGVFTPPADIGNGAVLFNFELAFSAPGTYHLGFQLNDGVADQTYYGDIFADRHYWAVLDESQTIVVQ